MPSNKDRIYVALYARQDPNTYHWALLVSPKVERGAPGETTRYHAVNKLSNRNGTTQMTWSYEKRVLQELQTQLLLVRVLVAKMEGTREELERTLRNVQIVQDDPRWTCRIWVRDAIRRLSEDRILGTGMTDWETIESSSKQYVETKKQQGRFQVTPLPRSVPTYDLIDRRETAQ